MAENIEIGDETLNNLTDSDSEKQTVESIPVDTPDNLTLKQKTETPEVHKHSPHVMHKKKWTAYLLEFFMLFLAVFLGFFAENIREDTAERHRELEYIQSMINDLKTDTTKLHNNIIVFQKMLLMQDTLLEILPSQDQNVNPISLSNQGFNQTFFRNSEGIDGYPDFIYTDATIQQLKNSGGFRLIRSRETIDSIMAYDAAVKIALIGETQLSISYNKLEEYSSDIFNYRILNEEIESGKNFEQSDSEKIDLLLTHDKIILSKYYYKLFSYRALFETVIDLMEQAKLSATNLINFLRTKYHMN